MLFCVCACVCVCVCVRVCACVCATGACVCFPQSAASVTPARRDTPSWEEELKTHGALLLDLEGPALASALWAIGLRAKAHRKLDEALE